MDLLFKKVITFNKSDFYYNYFIVAIFSIANYVKKTMARAYSSNYEHCMKMNFIA